MQRFAPWSLYPALLKLPRGFRHLPSLLLLLAALVIWAPDGARAGPEGSWSSEYGEMVIFPAPRGGVIATYRSDGKIYGSLQGNRLTGRWSQPEAKLDCGAALGGNRYWGDVDLIFNEAFTAFTGQWNRCGGEDVSDWSGTRAGPGGEESVEGPRPKLVAIEIIGTEGQEPLNEIAVGERFHVKLTYAERPRETITENVMITTESGNVEMIAVTGNSRVIVSGSILVAPSALPDPAGLQ